MQIILFTPISLKDKDTIRVYNIHLESLKMNTSQENFGTKDSDKLLEQMEASFQKQAKQVELFLQHEKKWHWKKNSLWRLSIIQHFLGFIESSLNE